jgi:hypothetical protein
MKSKRRRPEARYQPHNAAPNIINVRMFVTIQAMQNQE